MKTILLLIGLCGAPLSGRALEAPPVLGHLHTRQHIVTLHAGEPPRYSVRSKQGKPLAENISARQLRANFPELERVVNGTAPQWAGL
jgi:hypothetical protein